MVVAAAAAHVASQRNAITGNNAHFKHQFGYNLMNSADSNVQMSNSHISHVDCETFDTENTTSIQEIDPSLVCEPISVMLQKYMLKIFNIF